MTGIAAASFFSNACRFGGCGLHFESLSELIAHIEEIHIGKPPRHVTNAAASSSSATRSGYVSQLVTSCVLTTLLLGVVAVDVCGRPSLHFLVLHSYLFIWLSLQTHWLKARFFWFCRLVRVKLLQRIKRKGRARSCLESVISSVAVDRKQRQRLHYSSAQMQQFSLDLLLAGKKVDRRSSLSPDQSLKKKG